MKAAVWTAYGPAKVLQIREVETPIPRHDQVRIRIRATTVTAGDVEMRTLKLPMFLGVPVRLYVGLTKPARLTVLGQELAGEVELGWGGRHPVQSRRSGLRFYRIRPGSLRRIHLPAGNIR